MTAAALGSALAAHPLYVVREHEIDGSSVLEVAVEPFVTPPAPRTRWRRAIVELVPPVAYWIRQRGAVELVPPIAHRIKRKVLRARARSTSP